MRDRSHLPRQISLWLLLGIVVLVGVLFFQIVRPFIVALFVAAVLTVLFSPLHQWLTKRMFGYKRAAAAATTALVILLVLIPIGVTLLMAGTQVMESGKHAVAWLEDRSNDGFDDTIEQIERTRVGATLDHLYRRLPPDQQDQLRASAVKVANGISGELYQKTRGMISDAFGFGVGVCIMTLALYYFLADREIFVGELHRMMPLENREEQKLTDRFHSVCRGVVLGTLVAGMTQAGLAGIGFAVLGVPQIWMLIVLCMFFSFIPFLGSALVWGAVAVWLLTEGRVAAGLGLATYGVIIISTSDNLVRSYVIGNQAKLHPLVALVTVLGALNLMGLWGIFVGPMVAAFFYALLNIAKERIIRDKHETARD
ncbi:AI-2E family transporter [Stieleria sp. TO1_6]|uniref:AI-2E family transporter n=1 Tax=Stieleria tagensis TaxID=2956795 RepID=UPI00209B5B15|nr:AI-2E family transporter [Stieleria tagensis]MCO8121673.1 AI-2E family transporter [Stieleria tagensis]